MKILFITAFPPNNITAGQNYTRQLIEDLSKNHKIDLIYWDKSGHNLMIPEKVSVLKKYTINNPISNIRKLISYFPLFSKRYSKEAKKYISSVATNYDMVYFDFSQVMIYSLYLDHPKKIGMSHDVISQKFERKNLIKPIKQWINYSEREILNSFNSVYTFSSKDSDYLKDQFNIPSSPISFYITPEIIEMKNEEFCVDNFYVMYGAWKRKENQDSIKWLLKTLPQINLKIIGGGLPLELKEEISKHKNYEYLGFIDNPYPIIAHAKALIAPLWQGAGVKVKAIESLALGTPVIGTHITFEGIKPIIYNNRSCFYDIDAIDISKILEIANTINDKDKLEIRKMFLQSYGDNKFSRICESQP